MGTSGKTAGFAWLARTADAAAESLARNVGASIRYLYMVVLTAATLSLVVLTLAAYQFQQRIDQAASSQDGVATAQVLHQLRGHRDHLRHIERLRDDRWRAWLDREVAVPVAQRAELLEVRRSLEDAHRQALPPSLKAPALPAGPPWLPVDLTASAAAAVMQPVATAAAGGEAVALAAEAYRAYLEYEARRWALAGEAPASVAGWLSDAMYLERLGELTQGRIDAVGFALMPSWLLSLIVTLAMGALGGLLYVTKSFLNDRIAETGGAHREYKPLSWFLLRPLLGIVTAFAVFVFLQAGLALTDGALGSGGGTVNPYLVAFIAIISGLMSWQAIERIETWGTRFFGIESIHRWAYGLAGTLQVQGKSVQDLATAIDGIDEKSIRDWIDQRRRVPPDLQKRIAEHLSADPRVLFSDQAPSNA